MKKIFGILAMILLIAGTAFGQAISVNGGAIQGAITDPTGAKIPGATVTVTSPETGFSKILATDSSGVYTVGPLNPGAYKVTVTAPGFDTTTVSTVVRTGTVTSGDFKLTLGKSSEVVEVNAGSIQVNSEQITVSDVITKDQIDSLPVNGRNFLDVAQIEPGVILQPGSSFDPTKSGYSAISVGGVSGRTTRILLDGQDITDEFVGTTIFTVSEGSIGEFQLNRSTQDVSGDVTSTGQVLVSTRSGINTVHGMAFYNFQDYRALFANGNFGQPNPQFQRNQYGGSVGGPILKDKLFYFANLERIQQAQAAPVGLGAIFAGSASTFGLSKSTYGSPYKETYMAGRLDWNGPLHGHYFVRGNYNFNGSIGNFGAFYSLYTNRDNTYGVSSGADFAPGHFTHSFRGGYEKFHNFIADQTAGNTAIYNPIPSATIRYSGQLVTGPNVDAPQGTFQSDKQARYDGTYTYHAHIFKFGASMNRIESAAFAAFFGLAPRITESASTKLAGTVTASNPLGLGCSGVVGAAACPGDPINGYDSSSVVLGNGLGYSTAEKGFGLGGGAGSSWRGAFYLGDSYKVTPNLVVTAGLRWSIDTNRENNDLAAPTCATLTSAVTTTSLGAAGSPCNGLAPTTSLFALYNSSFTGSVRQPMANFAPQIGLNYSPGNHKTSLRAGFGIFYESVVFNNTSNARSGLLASGPFFGDLATTCSTFSLTYPDQSVHTTSPDGTSLQVLCQQKTVSQAAPQFVALQKQYQANAAANAISANGSYIGQTLSASGLYAPNYKQPYSEQWNAGVQRELFRGAVISVDYIHSSTLKIGQTLDINHVGAARNFNKANATTAVNNMITKCGGGTVASIIVAGGCQGAHPNTTVNGQLVLGSGATLTDFAGQGLDSTTTYAGTSPYTLDGKAVAGTAGPGAFTGNNPLLGSGAFIQPVGRSGYDALQVVYREQKNHPAPYVDSANVQVSYSRSRIVSTGGIAAGDEFFSNGVLDNDNPTAYMGRSGLDHSNELNFGGSMLVKHGPRIGLIGHFYSAAPGTLALDGEQTKGAIFQTDVTGDGTTGDIAPGTLPGAYMHQVNGASLQKFITSFNATQAGKLTPAGQQVVNSGLFTQAQFTSIGGDIQPLANLPQATALNNPAFRALDMSISYPIRLKRIREGLSLEPSISFYNVANFSNFGTQGTTLFNSVSAGGGLNNTAAIQPAAGTGIVGGNSFSILSPTRTQRGTGTFDQGAPRSTEFGLKLDF
jgi:hypothetical protein